ncbi:XrtV sorting system accessory protein [Sphingomonas flavescens]|uniref:XrtV sorting system accessory protein n=1 Tax=Sphingomonas flavescens TaxID=3132797 RepID=UPI002803DF1E|nr:XrtV sorting system accessory protein [Sphingomonas limnosediminicola]
MSTVYDWVSLGIFAGLVVLFLQRSTGEGAEKDASLLYYLGAGVGCAAANYFGNEKQHVIAIALLVATIGFIIYFLKPFPTKPAA